MRFKFRAQIQFEGEIDADNAESAEMEVFERLADEVTAGEIRVDRFENEIGGDVKFPMLTLVEVTEKKDGAA